MKHIEFDNPNFTCGDDDVDYCIVSENDSVQGSVEGGVGFAWRVRAGSPLEVVEEDRVVHAFTPQNRYPGFNTAGATIVAVNLGIRISFGRPR